MKKVLVSLLSFVCAVSLCACGGPATDTESGTASAVETSAESVKEEQNDETTEDKTVKVLDFTLDEGNVKFIRLEKADSNLTDEKNAYVFIFDYTNFQDKPCGVSNTFQIKFFQNGAELSESPSYHTVDSDQYECVHAFFSDALKDGKITFGQIVVAKDDSPITVMAKKQGSSDEYQLMEVDLSTASEGKKEEVKKESSTTTTTEKVPEPSKEAVPTQKAEGSHKNEYMKLEYNNFDAVRVVQNALNEQGYSCGSADGSIGSATREAITRFQADHGLNQTGAINDELIDALGCWDEADLRFCFCFCDKDLNPIESFSRSEVAYIKLFFSNVGRANILRYNVKTIGPDGFLIYNQMDVVYDENGYAGLGGSVYFNTPDIAPTGTMTSEVYDTDDNLLARAYIQVV